MNSKVIKALYKKEIFDVLRDKKTLLMMIVIPLVLYPLMFVLSMYFASTMITESTTHTYTVGYENFSDPEKEIDILSEISGERNYDLIFLSISPCADSLVNSHATQFGHLVTLL